MTASHMHAIRQIAVPRQLIEEMLETMREFGTHGWELLVLWLGEIDSTTGKATVIQAFVPKQKAISSEDGIGYFVNSEALFQLNQGLSKTGLRLIAQVHSHPRDAYHSEADDRYAIVTTEGGLSLVVPDFGAAPADPGAWAVYRLYGQEWVEVDSQEVRLLFTVVS